MIPDAVKIYWLTMRRWALRIDTVMRHSRPFARIARETLRPHDTLPVMAVKRFSHHPA